VRSVSSLIRQGLPLACVLAVVVLTGCNTTQDKAARLHIRSQRILAGREGVKVRELDKNVDVVKASLVESDGDAAIAVTLKNNGSQPVNDLPVVVGVRTADGKQAYLNESKGAYFQAHIPALAAGEQTTWVYTGKDAIPAADSVFAKVGVAPSPPVATATQVPKLEVSAIDSSSDKVEATVSNDTGFPQYDLAVYAWASKGGEYVAAGTASVGDLEAGDSAHVALKLVGNADGADLHVSAPPTIFE
jgi:hypothetical protein